MADTLPPPKAWIERSGHKASTWGGIAALGAAYLCQLLKLTDPQHIALVVAGVSTVAGYVRTYLDLRLNPSVCAKSAQHPNAPKE